MISVYLQDPACIDDGRFLKLPCIKILLYMSLQLYSEWQRRLWFHKLTSNTYLSQSTNEYVTNQFSELGDFVKFDSQIGSVALLEY